MSTQDYSARDKAVRHNIYASVRRRDGLSHELFATYWRDVHSTLCSRLPGLGFYVRADQAAEGKVRYSVRECRHRELRASRLNC